MALRTCATLLQTLTTTAAGLTTGKPVGNEAFDPALLTITFGFGAGIFDTRFGLADRRPAALVDMPHFKGDKLEADLSDGDIGVQCCSASHEVATKALQAIVAAVNGTAALRWSQYGFIRDPLPGEGAGTPCNIKSGPGDRAPTTCTPTTPPRCAPTHG